MAIVQEYGAANDNPASSTFTLSSKIQREIEENGVARPKGYTVSWHSNPEVENHHFGQTHPMKPWRLTLTKSLILSYGMHTAMDSFVSRPATKTEIAEFHKSDYVEFLSIATPANILNLYPELATHPGGYTSPIYGVGDDCPIFDGLFPYCALYTGASMDAARKLCANQSDIAVNWSGGLHHAKKGEASGFCYVNDIVLAILQLLRHHPRVLYIDIDVHHGDGVEQAFWSTDRVLCVSFHKYDKETFFPGTGPLDSTGPIHPDNPGKNYTINVPLNDGIDDPSYAYLFESVVGPAVAHYQPTAIVLQCGADSLGHDRLGCFNLNIRGHGSCVTYVKSFNLPLLVVGGGGYTPRNVARAWAHETSICIGADRTLNPELPRFTPHREAFRREGFTLFPNLGGWRKENMNDKAHIMNIIRHVHEQLRYMKGAPGVKMGYIPDDIAGWKEECEDELKERRMEREEKLDDRGQLKPGMMGMGIGPGMVMGPGMGVRREMERNGGNGKVGEFMA